jgi:23S rRNA (adenine1618-N6)-methyltransferase
VKALNKSFLSYYNIIWDIPEFYLCYIPGRADYIHYVADLLASTNNGIIQRRTVNGLDVEVVKLYLSIMGMHLMDGTLWGTDIDEKQLKLYFNY